MARLKAKGEDLVFNQGFYLPLDLSTAEVRAYSSNASPTAGIRSQWQGKLVHMELHC